MRRIDIVKQKTPGKDEWRVIWDGEEVYRRTGQDAEFYAGAFADGLERGLTGSKQPLYANSQVRLEGVMYSDDGWDHIY